MQWMTQEGTFAGPEDAHLSHVAGREQPLLEVGLDDRMQLPLAFVIQLCLRLQ
jgi:hypothetical protein